MARPFKICPRCERRECENFYGEYDMYCAECNDKLADIYREQQDFKHWHEN